MGDLTHQTDDDGDAARAFEALRAEVAALRRGVDLVTRQGSAAPDYSPTLGAIAKELKAVAVRLDALERAPALATTPASLRGEIDGVARSVAATVSRPFAEAVQEVRGAAHDLTALAGRLRERQEQRMWLLTVGALGLMAGVGLWYVAAGLLPRSVGDGIAASLIAGDRWHAGETLMEQASPETWDRMARLYKACPQDAATELCTAAMALRAAAPGQMVPRNPAIAPSQPTPHGSRATAPDR
jgi:hypothetical protein